jgi:hypothetical protein
MSMRSYGKLGVLAFEERNPSLILHSSSEP